MQLSSSSDDLSATHRMKGADLREGLRVIKVAPLKAIYLVEDRKVEIARITLAQ